MENRKTIKFPSGDYYVSKNLYRTKGSHNQIITEDNTLGNLEKDTVFYIVERESKKYWVKEHITDLRSIEVEWETCAKHQYSRCYPDNSTFNTVKFFDKNENAILMEYLEGYENLAQVSLNALNKYKLCKMLYDFIEDTNLVEYDLSFNNVMLKINTNKIDVKLIDFDVACINLKKHGLEFIKKVWDVF